MLRKIKDFLGLQKSVSVLLIMVIFVGMGEKLAERFLPKYIMLLGGGAISVGFLNGLDNLLSALYSFPGGYLSDKIGYKKSLIFFNLFAMAGYLIVIAFPYWQAVIIGSVFFISWDALSLPATMSLVSNVLPSKKHTMGVTMHSLFRRVPMALGPLAGGYLISVYGGIEGIRIAFCLAFLLALISLILQQSLMEDKKMPVQTGTIERMTWKKALTPELKNLLISDILIRFCEQIPYAFVVIWCLDNIKITAMQFGVLTAVEMATAVFIYIPVAALADKGHKKRYVTITFIFFTIFPIALMYCQNMASLYIAFIIRGLKEFGEPTRKTLIMDLAPENAKAYTFGVYYLVRDIIVSLAAFGGAYIWQVSPELNFMTAAAFGLAGTIYFVIFGRDLK
ncbi:MAG: MFS transporter [Candidatus Wallbacteria bacterium]